MISFANHVTEANPIKQGLKLLLGYILPFLFIPVTEANPIKQGLKLATKVRIVNLLDSHRG